MRFTTNLETDFNDETAVNMESNFSFDLLLLVFELIVDGAIKFQHLR